MTCKQMIAFVYLEAVHLFGLFRCFDALQAFLVKLHLFAHADSLYLLHFLDFLFTRSHQVIVPPAQGEGPLNIDVRSIS